MENSILNNLIIDPGIIIILMMIMIIILLVLQIKNSFKLNRFMKKYKSFMKGKTVFPWKKPFYVILTILICCWNPVRIIWKKFVN